MLEVLKHERSDAPLFPQALDTMERQLQQLVRLVDDLLDLNRITHDRIELRKSHVDLNRVIDQAVHASWSLAESAGLALRLTAHASPIYLNADAVRLTQVFDNLLNNSCKYTAPGGTITVTTERQGDEAIVTVADSGIGIPPDQLENIFDMFTQVDRSHDRSQGGLGIGLTLVKRLVQMHAGSIEARSAGEGKGSEFIVRLPIAVESSSVRPAPSATAPLTNRRILIVDDNRDAATSLAILLKMSGNQIYTAHDGVDACLVAEEQRPDLVLLDIGLPTLNGYEVCRKLRAQPWGRSMVLVALTGWGHEADRRKSSEAGFDGHLVKPVDPAALGQLLASLTAQIES
jgi:CheY-like chemotaxis protein/two-component sensor histidine kinase